VDAGCIRDTAKEGEQRVQAANVDYVCIAWRLTFRVERNRIGTIDDQSHDAVEISKLVAVCALVQRVDVAFNSAGE
jgi:hypothetical protein